MGSVKVEIDRIYKATPHNYKCSHATSNFSSDEAKSAVNTFCIAYIFTKYDIKYASGQGCRRIPHITKTSIIYINCGAKFVNYLYIIFS